MAAIKIISLLVLEALLSVKSDEPIPAQKHFIYDSYPYDTDITVYVDNGTEQIMDFYEVRAAAGGLPTRVQVSANNSVSTEYPVFVTAAQQKGVSAWEVPPAPALQTMQTVQTVQTVQTGQTADCALLFNKMARTLCPHDAGPDIKSENRPTIHVSTENPQNTSVHIKLSRVTDFYLEVNKDVSLNVTPSTPRYYYFSFEQPAPSWNDTAQREHAPPPPGLPRFNYTVPKSVILIIDSPDDICATVSIQNNSCPVFDNEKEISYQGYHLTMTTKGGITLTQSMFPRGFYVVFIVKESDADCTGESETTTAPPSDRLKLFKFSIAATVSYKEYAVGALVLVAVVALVAAFVVMVGAPFRRAHYDELLMEEEHEEVEEPAPSTSQAGLAAEEAAPSEELEPASAASWTQTLTVGRLTQAPQDTLQRRSDRYLWGSLTLAVVYALPVVQLLFTYQQMVFATGNQDLCYYNFLCAHPLWFLSDFNHVYSNIGYVVLGGVFMMQVRARQRTWHDRKDVGIPQHGGLLYSMGLALCMEGFLSACYHLCPNKMNFQFDSSFMYVIAVLVMIKLYQNRHSDIIPSAHSTFMLIALVMALGLCGILFPSVYFSAVFTALHLAACLVLTLHIYYAGSFRIEAAVLRRAWSQCRGHGVRALVPSHRPRAVLLALANAANWTLAIYSAVVQEKDFARQLLAILMGNAILYTMFYICMKIIHRERILPHTWVYFATAHVAWFAALHQFLNGNTRWSETPALSRRHNAQCSLLHTLDRHDAWHAASAAAMFLSFNVLLTVDDALAHTRRALINTF